MPAIGHTKKTTKTTTSGTSDNVRPGVTERADVGGADERVVVVPAALRATGVHPVTESHAMLRRGPR